jgi:signal transduction histidine kinase
LNLVQNAVEAAGQGGAVEIVVGADGSVEVLDTGPGPPADLADRLFEPFVSGKAEGVGLGLALARRVAETAGGRLSWDRRGGRTCFRLELPRRDGETA